MDKTFNFFKTKVKKEYQKPRNNSKSNSSKASYSRNSEKHKAAPLKQQALSKKEREIRQAIEFRYQKSKLRTYQFAKLNQNSIRSPTSSDSSQMQQFKHLLKLKIVDLKQYHNKQETPSFSNNSSQERKKFNMRFKMKEHNFNGVMKTQGNQSIEKNPYLNRMIKNVTPNKISKKTDDWKFISIQLKEDLSKPKTRKPEVKINSHRSYNIQQEKGLKIKSNSSMSKYHDKVPKLKELKKICKSQL